MKKSVGIQSNNY